MSPLQGITVIEIAGLRPAPVCGVLLADMGAEVFLCSVKALMRPISLMPLPTVISPIPNRGKKSTAPDFKDASAVEIVLDLMADADALTEGLRRGVMERSTKFVGD